VFTKLRNTEATQHSSPFLVAPQLRAASDRRSLHNDEAGPLQVLHKALGDDRRHDLVSVVDALAALEVQRERKRVGDDFGCGGKEGIAAALYPSPENK
jgi:hypothetical protein